MKKQKKKVSIDKQIAAQEKKIFDSLISMCESAETATANMGLLVSMREFNACKDTLEWEYANKLSKRK
jgi:hypothetical protein